MGADLSKLSPPQAEETLHEILGVKRRATPDEIKRAYRKIALEYHPDRNRDNIEEATAKFAKVQHAYDTLKDEAARTWYESLLIPNYEQYVRNHTSIKVLQVFMSPYCDYRKNLRVGSSQYYKDIRELFLQLRNEELEAAFDREMDRADVAVAETTFGDADTEWQDVKQFYDAWDTFSTLKLFEWENVYPSHLGVDRIARRNMEIMNKRRRDANRLNFNEVVRAMIKKIRHSDPRVKKQRDKDQERRDRAKGTKKKVPKPARPEYNEQEWAKVDEDTSSDEDMKLTDVGKQLYECVVCDEGFKRSMDLAMHESTAEHLKALKKMKREMREEDVAFGLDSGAFGSDLESPDLGPGPSPDPTRRFDIPTRSIAEPAPASHTEPGASAAKDNASTLAESMEGLSVEEIMSQMDGTRKTKGRENTPEAKPKVGKAKKKRMQREQATTEFALKCTTCQTEFPTRSKLFEHTKASRHAAPVGLKY